MAPSITTMGMSQCPVATTGTNVGRAIGRARKVFERGAVRIGTARLNELIERAIKGHQPPVVRNRRLKVFYATHSTSSVVSVTGAHATRMSCPGFVDYKNIISAHEKTMCRRTRTATRRCCAGCRTAARRASTSSIA